MDIASQSANKALLSYLSHQSLRSHKTKQKEEKVVCLSVCLSGAGGTERQQCFTKLVFSH